MRFNQLSSVALAVSLACISLQAHAMGSIIGSADNNTFNESITVNGDGVLSSINSNQVTVSQTHIGIFPNRHNLSLNGDTNVINVLGAGRSTDLFEVLDATAIDATTGNLILGNENSTNVINLTSDRAFMGIRAALGQRVEINGESFTLNAESLNKENGGYYYGLIAQNASTTAAMEDRARLIVNAQNTVINVKNKTANAVGLVSMSQGILEVHGNLEVNADIAILARGDSIVRINPDGNKTVKLNGNVDFNFDKGTSGTKIDSDVNVHLSGADSYWKGGVVYSYGSGRPDDPAKLEVHDFKLTISDNATWYVTPTIKDDADATIGKSTIALNYLTLNDGIISIEDADQTLEIENMQGNGGTVNVQTVKNGDSVHSAKLSVKEFSSDMQLTERYVGVTADEMTVADLDQLSAISDSTGKVTRNQVVPEGDIIGELSRTVGTDGTVGTISEGTNTKQDAYKTLTATNFLAWRHDMNDLTKRMGELRDSPEGVGAWARVYGSEQESGSQNMLTKSTSIQVGGDVDVGNGWKVGVAFSYTDSDTSYSLGSADSDSYAAAVYGSWLAENGQFVDLIAKYTRMSSDFTLNGFDGSYDNNAFSVSAEYGWHFPVNDIAFVEPQVELTYGHISGDKFASNSGTTIDQDDYESLIGRAGLRFGFYFPEHRGTIYARVSGVYDFMGEYEYTATKPNLTKRFKDDLGGAWVEYAVGANFNWTENTYTYVDLERTSGGEVKENYRWNVGLRHVF